MASIKHRDLDGRCVLSGRGPFVYKWPGNITFHEVIDIFHPTYEHQDLPAKSLVVEYVVSFLLAKGMRFLKRDPHAKEMWIPLTRTEIRRKCAHLIRDKVRLAAARNLEEEALEGMEPSYIAPIGLPSLAPRVAIEAQYPPSLGCAGQLKHLGDDNGDNESPNLIYADALPKINAEDVVAQDWPRLASPGHLTYLSDDSGNKATPDFTCAGALRKMESDVVTGSMPKHKGPEHMLYANTTQYYVL